MKKRGRLTGRHARQTGSMRRREVLGLLPAALSGLTASGAAFSWDVARAEDRRSASGLAATADSVLMLWMGGGVTHIDSFDPKPEAPSEIRGTLSAISTSIPGLFFNEAMPRMATVADKITLLRSFSHDNNDHLMSQAYTLSGRKVPMAQVTTEPNIGSIVSYLLGPRAGLPGYIAVPGITRPGPPPYNLFVGGWLGSGYAPFAVGGEPAEPDFTANLFKDPNPPEHIDEQLTPADLELSAGFSRDRLISRAALRGSLDQAESAAQASGKYQELEQHYAHALDLLSSPQIREAFDLSQELPASRDQYGHTKIGSRCLLARRLVEAGARFVMVDYGYDPQYGNLWDNHRVPSQRQPHICDIVKKPYHLAGTDQACAALLADMHDRGLLERTLVIFYTEFGRTPRINSDGGRDHWGPAGSIFFAGGGAPAGQCLGQTDKIAGYPVTQGYSPGDVAATIYRALGIATDTLLYDRQNRPIPVLPAGDPIPGVLQT